MASGLLARLIIRLQRGEFNGIPFGQESTQIVNLTQMVIKMSE